MNYEFGVKNDVVNLLRVGDYDGAMKTFKLFAKKLVNKYESSKITREELYERISPFYDLFLPGLISKKFGPEKWDFFIESVDMFISGQPTNIEGLKNTLKKL